MRNIRLTIRFDGTCYSGWQRQQSFMSVQQAVEEAIEKVCGAYSFVEGCGRTDARVHALSYTASFTTESEIPSSKLPLALNTKLPKDIRVSDAKDVDLSFHARFSAIKKTYRYEIQTSKIPDPFLNNRAWHFPYDLDIAKMQSSAKCFIGTHDFSGFMAVGGQVKTTVRTIYDATVFEEDGKVIFEVTGNGFLYNMVRIMAGTLAYIGSNKITEDLTTIIESRQRDRAGITAPPQGLYLKKVYYEED